jgi:hypothetical protein
VLVEIFDEPFVREPNVMIHGGENVSAIRRHAHAQDVQIQTPLPLLKRKRQVRAQAVKTKNPCAVLFRHVHSVNVELLQPGKHDLRACPRFGLKIHLNAGAVAMRPLLFLFLQLLSRPSQKQRQPNGLRAVPLHGSRNAYLGSHEALA